ncbi:hypothetical protein L6452_09050 [Arctium lappa]|uniref:Uncharacterized protein n=1 Tax=Arctium lappa TaxID=4217 RepID=A0ACB9DJR7_ARCLA|nr:hypothetical protein L6452_09050 [Arctium lappa]
MSTDHGNLGSKWKISSLPAKGARRSIGGKETTGSERKHIAVSRAEEREGTCRNPIGGAGETNGRRRGYNIDYKRSLSKIHGNIEASRGAIANYIGGRKYRGTKRDEVILADEIVDHTSGLGIFDGPGKNKADGNVGPTIDGRNHQEKKEIKEQGIVENQIVHEGQSQETCEETDLGKSNHVKINKGIHQKTPNISGDNLKARRNKNLGFGRGGFHFLKQMARVLD